MKRNWSFALRFTLLMVVVATTMAVSCPKPDPIGPEPPEPVITKSPERQQLEASYTEGLFLKGAIALAYNQEKYQRAASHDRATYRIQSDDQTRYLHVRYTEEIPSAEGEEVECEIQYRLAAGEQTTLIVKFIVVKATEEYLWLWNEFQKVGMIVQRI
jgi:hypothetical protein